ncbi:Alpha amylase catalytic region [Bradyrhizobium sp. STM 3843]|uniref:alpha-amylase family protein n=1 Tax=Bradyrhizobium sp. STM 3843 TaxID=551947 RepID=UPI000240AF20|nr:alpha-amylase family protein [Bradyrhizobium sp. STM 3843]CCE05707.1 Alpha amylase catalytic region [Bradyrhizobium sp. STM 3843]
MLRGELLLYEATIDTKSQGGEALPGWVERSVFWHIYPLGFVGAEPQLTADAIVTHRLRRLIGWLDYAVELGASALLLAPIFASSTHGYDTIDHFRIDPRLGEEEDFNALIAAAHAKGLRVVLDGVFNHVGRDFPRFQRAIASRANTNDAAWFRLAWPANSAGMSEPDYATFEGHAQLVALNHDAPEVADYVTGVMNHWLDRGADGWRLDAAYAVPRSFWHKVLPLVRARHPDAYIFGEVIHGDYAGFVRETGVDAVTQYELWKAIWSALNDRNFFELAWALERHNALLDSFVPQTFIGNHDVTRIASQLKDERHLAHALAILMTIAGTPSIYAGDEQAFRGIKEHRAGGDDAIRPAFPAAPDGLAPFGWPVYRLHQLLIGLRRRHPWLHRARSRMVELHNTDVVIEASCGSSRLWTAVNVSDAPVTRTVPAAAQSIAGELAVHRKDQVTNIVIPAHGFGILAPC